jgi:photosystem II stability/assembly factor-like uncharacterized protein
MTTCLLGKIESPDHGGGQRPSFWMANGFAATASGEAYQTTDGGKTFTKLALDGGSPSDFYFLNDDIGFAFGRSGYLARTEDGGKSWNRIATDSTYDLRDMVFLDKGHGYVVGAANTPEGKNAGIGESANKGLTWNSGHRACWILVCVASVNHVWTRRRWCYHTTDKEESWEHNRAEETRSRHCFH